MSAHDILAAAAAHMQDRAATYDKPEGERSMGATVVAFNAVSGRGITEEQGWLFMALLKAVRSQQNAYRADSYEDGAAYFALAGEAACRDRNGGWTPEAIKDDALPDSEQIARQVSGGTAVEHNPESPFDGAPEWAKYKAQDADGEWWWYSGEPLAEEGFWRAFDADSELALTPNPNWRDTLITRN